MMRKVFRSFTFCTPLLLSSLAAMGQLVVDATIPARGLLRNPTAGRSGSIGRKLPLLVVLGPEGPVPDKNGMPGVVFTLTNTAKTEMTLPISLHPRDLEPSDPSTSYTVEVLSLYVTSDKGQDSTPSGRIDLYGSTSSPATLAKLGPGESIRVLTRLSLPPEEILVGHAVLDHQTVRTSNGQTTEDTEERGFALSAKYKRPSFYRPPN